MGFSPRFCAVAFLAFAVGVAACGGPRSTPLSPEGNAGGAGAESTQKAALTLQVRLPATVSGTTLSATVYPDGGTQPVQPSASVALSSSACAVTGSERLCTLTLQARTGLLDVAVRAGSGQSALSGTALRQLLTPAGATLSLAFDGSPATWAFSPQLIVGPADGSDHLIPFAVVARDAQGFTLLAGAPAPPAAVAVNGDALHVVSISAQGAGRFLARYAGQPVDGPVTLSATAPGASAASANFASLVASPTSFEIAQGTNITISAALAGWQGAFEAVSSGANCAVSPSSATPAAPGATVAFVVRLISGESCSISVQTGASTIPIVIAGKKAVARPQIGIGPSKLQHVVVLFQENRSFDNIFGGLDANGHPFPGADTVSNPNPGEPTPSNHLGQPVSMSTGVLEECYDPFHDHPNSVTDVNLQNGVEEMNGFDEEGVVTETCAPTAAPTNYVYRTMEVTASEVLPYWQMGEAYAISDRMFEPSSSASYGPHLYLVSGQSANTIDNPSAGGWGCDAEKNGSWPGFVQVATDTGGEAGPGVPPCFYVESMADILDQHNVSWRYYGAPKTDFGYDWMAYDSFNDIRNGPDWSAKVFTPPSQILTDIGNGTLAAVTWVTPTNNTSDHPQAHENEGPAWITSVVNEIGQSKFWDTTAIFITWDDWGGWYDHVPPPITGPVSDGIRVPLIIVSPYVRAGYVSHVVHTTGSILHFTEEVFDLPSLGAADATSDDFSDAFNFSQAPRPFGTPIPSKYSKAQVMRAASQASRSNDPDVGD
jgi:phospholipase C